MSKFCVVVILCMQFWVAAGEASSICPTALVTTPDGKTLLVASAAANQVLCLDISKQAISSIALPLPPSGLAISADQSKLFATCSAPEGKICIIDLARRKVVAIPSTGHGAVAPVLSTDGETLFVCNQFDNDVSVIDLGAKKELCRIPVRREPVAADITQDGKFLLVANQLPTGRADLEKVAAVVSVVDLATRKVVKELQLPDGSGSLKDIRVSPDGKYAAVTHLASSFSRATTKVQFGWMNANALTVIDLSRMEIGFSILLDEPGHGAANPWGLAWLADGKTLAVAHAGTHEVSLIDFPKLLAAGNQRGKKRGGGKKPVLTYLSHYEGMDPGLPFLTGARVRVKLPDGDWGPRALAWVGRKLYTANYYSDTLSVIDLDSPSAKPQSIALGPKTPLDLVRLGDFYFRDASLCLQGWQSCVSCHPDGRADGFNWDLLNDGIGNPKNTKSLLLAFQTPPAMSLGVRADAAMAVRAGLKSILFTNAPEAVAQAIDAYLNSLKPVPSPHLVHGVLSASAKRGKRIFTEAGCADCHSSKLFTDLKPHDVGTRRTFDNPGDKFYTPTLIEVWRTAPYLHDGSAATVRDVLTTRNPHGEHGATQGLSEQQLNDLGEYLLSL